MKVTTNENGEIQLEEVFSGIILKTPSGEIMGICMRDSGFEFNYQGKLYSAQEGDVLPFKTSSSGNLLVDQRHEEEYSTAPGPEFQNHELSNVNKVETKPEMEKRWLECENLISEIKGTFIDQNLAKKLYQLQKGGFSFTESRLDNNTSIVVIQRQYDNVNFGPESIFLVRGLLGENLNMI